MNPVSRKIELLAPAKTAAIGKAAINCGADAVYLSAEKFGAREQAGNSLADIEELTAYAHLYYGRVYVALNTLLADYELDQAFSLIKSLAGIGVDGLIIQDLGLLELALPPIPLIASTQMNNDSLEKIQFLEKAGFSRVILPREMTADEIKAIHHKTSIALECFVHGALCVSYSGRCYMSYALGGRSANRGVCAQPCRRLYSLVNGQGTVLLKDQHLLSLKDLNRSRQLAELIEAGITSFKIEGRLKDMAYVKNTVAFYRKALDTILAGKKETKSSSGKTVFNFIPDLQKTFNRGFTDFGVKNRAALWSSPGTPKFMGEKIGTVKKTGMNHFTLVSGSLKPADGICFFDESGVLRGSMVNVVKEDRIYPDTMEGLSVKAVIYRNHDHEFIKKVSASTASERRVGVSMTLGETEDGFSLLVQDEDGNCVTVQSRHPKQAAEKKTAALETVKKQLSKLSDTLFYFRSLTSMLRETYFLPVSFLNSLRRQAVERLLIEREKNRPRDEREIQPSEIPYPVKTLDYRGHCLNQKAISFFRRHGAEIAEKAAESGLSMKCRELMLSKYCLKFDLDLCKKETDPLFLVDQEGNRFRLEFDCSSCRMSVKENG